MIEYFLKIDGIPGESQNDSHKGEIDVVSWSWGEAQTVVTSGGGGSAAARVTLRDLQCSMQVSKASPQLMLACASGKRIPIAVLSCRRAGERQQDFLLIKVSTVLVSAFETAGQQQSPLLDTVSLNFAKIEIEYREQSPTGAMGTAVKVGWDVAANRPV
ncbi:MAG: Hcp family type VI secretion system effector [Burkholderiales bacterium]